jgi:hypothetical protein
VSSCGVGKLDIFAVATNGSVSKRTYSGGWAAWQALGGQWTSDPAVGCTPATTVSLVQRGPDNALWYTTVTGS